MLAKQVGAVSYYKGRISSVVGTGTVVPWPRYSSYLDIEPDLAVVVGEIPFGASRRLAAERIAGYTVFCDISARDVQLAEMFGFGPTASKDMDCGNVLGPWLVTPDEIDDVRGLSVEVATDRGRVWRGSTAEYLLDPIDVIVALATRQSLAAGSVIGMGTVPGCCGLDRDEWLDPGERIIITVAGLGALHLSFGVPDGPVESGWESRPNIPTIG